MDTDQKIIEAKIAAKDIAQDLEKIMLLVCGIVNRRRAWEIHAESPELFAVQLALSRAAGAAGKAREQLLQAIGMPPHTRFVHPLPKSANQHTGS